MYVVELVMIDSGVFFFKQKTAYELRISDWSSDVCSSDLSAAGGSLSPWALNHFVRFVALLAVAIVLSYFQPRTFRDWAYPAYGLIIVLLIVVELIGVVGGGAQSWLDLGVFQLQPSELMKPVIVLILAGFYAGLPTGEIRKWSASWPPALLTIVTSVMILLQPDLGTTLLLLFSAPTIMFLPWLPP